jgi:hypothetical protein
VRRNDGKFERLAYRLRQPGAKAREEGMAIGACQKLGEGRADDGIPVAAHQGKEGFVRLGDGGGRVEHDVGHRGIVEELAVAVARGRQFGLGVAQLLIL